MNIFRKHSQTVLSHILFLDAQWHEFYFKFLKRLKGRFNYKIEMNKDLSEEEEKAIEKELRYNIFDLTDSCINSILKKSEIIVESNIQIEENQFFDNNYWKIDSYCQDIDID